MSSEHSAQLQAFIIKWEASGAAERANAHLFINDLCAVLGVEPPQPKTPDERANAYVFEKTIPGANDTSNFIDLYKRGHFILETKQGASPVGADHDPPVSAEGIARQQARKKGHGTRGTHGWDVAMEKARNQAENYARRLPKSELTEGLRPPFLVIVDVGHSIALYADWTRAGGHYAPFPDPASYRIQLKDLLRPEIRERLHTLWTDPLSLDPSRRSAKVTREVADRLAQLARALEGKHPPEDVSSFLMRCLFTMFSEDVDLLPMGSFTRLLGEMKQRPESFVPALESLWESMDKGSFSPFLNEKLLRFNGGLFAHPKALPLSPDHIQLLIEAATANWKDVEPAIFGTLLERALDPRERHKLGAHYTPRAYVERLVNPTVIEPLRSQWQSVQVAALHHAEGGNNAKAIKEVEAFLHQLATLRILDPACGSGNFLYVTLELLKRLEGEVLNTLHDLGATTKLELEGVMVTPANFFGIEVNPRAADIAEQVLWIGFLQWHLRTHGNLRNLQEPIIKDLHNIEKRDAVLDWDSITELTDAEGRPVTRWDGRTTKPHPVTGEEVPDAEARVPQYQYHNPRPAKWPQADYIVGNPPFIGSKRMREALGDGYVESLRSINGNVPDSADFVMLWWDKAAEATRNGSTKRFGFITTNSIRQVQNRKVVAHHLTGKKPLSLAFAIPDHPWVDSADGAAVRVAMTTAQKDVPTGILQKVLSEAESENGSFEVILATQKGKIYPDLTIGADVASAVGLKSNEGLSSRGVQLYGDGFMVTPGEAEQLGLGKQPGLEKHIRPYLNGRDLTGNSRNVLVLDLFGLTTDEVRVKYPEAYQRVYERVKPARDQSREAPVKKNWWLHGRAREDWREMSRDLKRFVSTIVTSKHRFFVFLDSRVLPDDALMNIAVDDAYNLGVLSSLFHVTWTLAQGSILGPTPRYNNTRCFDTFPFPVATEAQQATIRSLGEQLDAHRKRQQAQHPELTMTGMYNVLEAVRAGTALTAKEKLIYEQGLVGILRQLHDELDAAVADAYGWSDLYSSPLLGRGAGGEAQILTRLAALNAARAAEEAQGHIRWLRPEYQAPTLRQAQGAPQGKLIEEEEEIAAAPAELLPWPKELPQQAAAVREVLRTLQGPVTVDAIAAHFAGKKTPKRVKEIGELVETLRALGVG